MKAGTGHGVAVGKHAPAAVPLVHEDIGHNVDRRLAAVAAARLGVQVADQRAGFAQRLIGAIQQAAQSHAIILGQPVQVLLHDVLGQRAGGLVHIARGSQLQGQAFPQIARGQSGRVQLLHQA
ncbi:hypothetical protein D3C86_1323280 [compost metagenome]